VQHKASTLTPVSCSHCSPHYYKQSAATEIRLDLSVFLSSELGVYVLSAIYNQWSSVDYKPISEACAASLVVLL